MRRTLLEYNLDFGGKRVPYILETEPQLMKMPRQVVTKRICPPEFRITLVNLAQRMPNESPSSHKRRQQSRPSPKATHK